MIFTNSVLILSNTIIRQTWFIYAPKLTPCFDHNVYLKPRVRLECRINTNRDLVWRGERPVGQCGKSFLPLNSERRIEPPTTLTFSNLQQQQTHNGQS